MLLTDRSSGFLSEQHTRASKSTETPFFSPKGAPEIHAGRVRPASERGIKQCRARESCFYAFTKLNLLFPLSLAFPCHSQLPEPCQLRALGRAKHPPGPAVWAEGGKCPSRSRWPGPPICGIDGAAAVALPLFSLGRGSNCLQLPLLLPRFALGSSEGTAAAAQQVHRGFPGFPRVLMLTGVLVRSISGQQAWVVGTSPGKPSLLLLSTQLRCSWPRQRHLHHTEPHQHP